VKIPLTTLIALFLVLGGCNRSGNSQNQSYVPSVAAATRSGNTIRFDPKSPQLARIHVGVVESANVPVEEFLAPGKIEPNPGRVSRVALPMAGRVREVLVVLGDAVQQRQAVLTLDSPDASTLNSALRQAEANIFQAKANLAKAEADLLRARDLFANRAIAQKEVLASETVVAQARASLEQAMASRDEMSRKLSLLGLGPGGMDQFITVRAPVAGKVVDVAVAPGEYRNDTSAAVLTIADLSTVWVAADVPESRIRLIQAGEPVSIMLPAFPDRTFTGRVKRIADQVDPQTRTIKVRAELNNAREQFRPEMSATIRHSHGFQKSPVVPKSALFQQQDRAIVYLERAPGEFEEVAVTVSWQDDRRAAIQSGLHEGDRIVTDGVTQLRAY
jgi:cobalt-zinc-cadmium efflux system membrane fusion protein